MSEQRKRRFKIYRRILTAEAIVFFLLLIAFVFYINSDNAKYADSLRVNNNNISISDNMDWEQRNIDFDTPDYVIDSNPDNTLSFNPHHVDSTNPENYISSCEIEIDGKRFRGDYNSSGYIGDISFDKGDVYTDIEGIVTFRGNNFRDDPTYGTTNLEETSLTSMWNVTTGALSYEDVVWSGSGWTGQPLMRCWSKEEKQHMNMHEWAKDKDELVEVIYACMDGYIYFLDMETGEQTRDKLWLGFTFKGAGALDPRGYPILYLGAGYDSDQGYSRAFIINLIDCTIIREFGSIDPFALRGTLSYFDSSALVDAGTDTLIYPGENGVLYLIHLGTHYDEADGKLTMDFDRIVKWRYNSKRTTQDKFWPGMETSAAIYDHYMYISDNGANLLCIDLNTLDIIWVQDILDDSNSTPVLSEENGHLYLYVSTSFHLGWRSSTTANVPIWKIDADTGEIIWKTEYECTSREGVSGGVQSTIALGKNSLDDYIYVTVSMTHGGWGGDIAAINKKDGNRTWEKQMAYTWSSPVCLYDSFGRGVVVYCASDGGLYMVDGITGDTISSLIISDGNIEASPAVYESNLVVGTRSGKICAVKIK